MQEVLENSRPSFADSRSSLSISADTSRRASLRTALPARNSGSPTASSPRTRLSRKRAASLELDIANHPRLDDLTLDSVSTAPPLTADPTREQVCLCQPDPKIPRPRNAFILYRQHYQASVVAQHPGLANPEISKIIGEQWRSQPPEVKEYWKQLAEEEKTRHQRQYPGYRYQPRRTAKGTSSRPLPTSNSDESLHCPKCNGRYISTPNTPLTPFTPAFEPRATTGAIHTPSTPSQINQTARLPYPSSMQNTRMESPRGGPPHPSMLRRPLYSGHPHLSTHHEVDDDTEMMSPDGSDPKRRRINQDSYRYNNDGPRGYAPSSGPFSAPQPFARNGALPVAAAGYRQHLPSTPRMLGQPRSMGPPPQYASANHQRRPSYTPQSATFDESLRLPPLQTHLPAAPSANSAKPDHRNEVRESHAKSVEAMVMTIPFVNKIKVLAKISPALAAPSALSPAIETRGATIAIEGSDKELLSEVGEYIKDHLEKDASCAIKTWLGPRPGSQETNAFPKDTVMTEGVSKEPEELFTDYLGTISSWHKKSQEMIKHITTPPSKPTGKSKDVVQAKQTPIALIPNGFSLTTSDAYAVHIPINDSYAPVDHWQWMATLWRGIIGPDLTIYAARVGKDDVVPGGIGGGGVEVRKDCSAIVVRVEEGKKMDEKTARRLGFEVLEFVRGEQGSFGKV